MVTCAPPMQGESHLNHCPHAPLPFFISPSPGSQTAPLPFPHHNTHIYIHHLHFYLLFVAQLYFTLALSPAPPHFRFFHHFMAIPLLPEPFPTLLYHNTLFYRAPHPMDDPPYFPAPACPLPPIFAFFTILWLSPCYQHHSPHSYIQIHCFMESPISWIAHPVPQPLPAPLPPIFGFLTILWAHFCRYFYSIPFKYVHT